MGLVVPLDPLGHQLSIGLPGGADPDPIAEVRVALDLRIRSHDHGTPVDHPQPGFDRLVRAPEGQE